MANDYLRRLEHAGRHLPPDRRRELIAEIEAHLAEVAPAGAPEHEVLEALERLGPAGDIVEAEQPFPPVSSPDDQRGLREWAAVILLPLGGFVFGVGWLLGLILLWSSRLWTTRDKLIGTLVVPGGLVTVLYVAVFAGSSATTGSCTGHGAPIDSRTGQATGPGRIHCTTSGGPGTATTILQIALMTFLILAPIGAAIYLARRARMAPQRLVAAGR